MSSPKLHSLYETIYGPAASTDFRNDLRHDIDTLRNGYNATVGQLAHGRYTDSLASDNVLGMIRKAIIKSVTWPW